LGSPLLYSTSCLPRRRRATRPARCVRDRSDAGGLKDLGWSMSPCVERCDHHRRHVVLADTLPRVSAKSATGKPLTSNRILAFLKSIHHFETNLVYTYISKRPPYIPPYIKFIHELNDDMSDLPQSRNCSGEAHTHGAKYYYHRNHGNSGLRPKKSWSLEETHGESIARPTAICHSHLIVIVGPTHTASRQAHTDWCGQLGWGPDSPSP